LLGKVTLYYTDDTVALLLRNKAVLGVLGIYPRVSPGLDTLRSTLYTYTVVAVEVKCCWIALVITLQPTAMLRPGFAVQKRPKLQVVGFRLIEVVAMLRVSSVVAGLPGQYSWSSLDLDLEAMELNKGEVFESFWRQPCS
jgi:hypothetical protein